MLKKWIVLVFSILFALTACRSPVYNQTVANVANVKLRAQAARAKSDRDALHPSHSLVVNKGAYVDVSPVNLEEHPSWINNHIVIRGDQLPFSYYLRVLTGGNNKSVLTKYQVGLNSAVPVSISYAGTVKGALDLLASRTGYVYSVRGNNIYWQAFITRTFDVAFMPGDIDYLLGKTSSAGKGGGGSSGGGGGGGNTQSFSTTSDYSESEFSSLKGKFSVWTDLEKTVSQLLSPDGKVTVSQATTSVTVRDRPTNVELIGQFVENMNHKLSRQVLVKVQILEIQLENDYDFGINWALITKAFHNTNFVFNGNYGTPVSITSFTSQAAQALAGGNATNPVPQLGTQINPNSTGLPSYTILFNALNQQGKTSVVTEPRVVCLNNQVSVIRIITQQGYVASIQNTSVGGSTSFTAQQNTVTSTVTPGNIVTGLTLYLLPKIMKDKIYMQVNADFSTQLALVPFGPANSQVQLPTIAVKHFNQRSMIHSGDTLILSGFRQLVNTANANQVLTSQALGGKAAQEVNKETIVLITPIILRSI